MCCSVLSNNFSGLMADHPLFLFSSLITLSLIKCYWLLLGFPGTNQTLSANSIDFVASSWWCHGVVGWERLQGNTFIKEGKGRGSASCREVSVGARNLQEPWIRESELKRAARKGRQDTAGCGRESEAGCTPASWLLEGRRGLGKGEDV